MEWLINNPSQGLIVIGLVLLIIEVAVLGFSTFVLFFLGLSTLHTGIAVSLNVVPADWSVIIWVNAVLAAIIAALTWKPLKRFQNKVSDKLVKNDYIGISFFTQDPVGPTIHASHSLSGVIWKLKSEKDIPTGTNVKIVRTEVGELWVEPAES